MLSGLAPFTGAAAGAGLSAGEGAFDALDLLNVEQHLRGIEAWDDVPQNIAMVDRISQALADGRSLSEGEYNFMVHELTEADLMSRGVEQDIVHDLAGQTHPTFANYDPEVIKQFSEYFNHNWLKYWEKK